MCALTKFRTQQNNSLLHVFARKVLNNASLRKLSGSVCVCARKPGEHFSFVLFKLLLPPHTQTAIRTTSTNNLVLLLGGLLQKEACGD